MRIAALLFLLSSSVLAADPTTVILVRHAEKAGKSGDVPLSEAGVQRAHELARVLAGVRIDAVYTTPYQRTRQTAAPVAGPRDLVPIEIDPKEVAARIRKEHAGGTVLVVGHSNTTPDVIRDLGIASPPPIPDSAYDDLFIVIVGEKATLLTLRYGAVAR